MRKPKRKYTRKVKQDAPQSNPSPVKEQDSTELFKFSDLPLRLRTQIESIIKMRKRVGLPDDSKERKEAAIKYFRGDRPR